MEMTLSERLAFRDRFDWAVYYRRRAIHRLRMGNRSDHRELMHAALFQLKLARQWKVKK
jgi:hypothetical protein